eukprot:6095868-Ditylum_brightwellii.AAC.2
MDTQIQPSIDWIKSQMTTATNSMALFQKQTLHAVQEAKEENTKVIQQVREENTQQEESNTKALSHKTLPAPSPNNKDRTAHGKNDVPKGNI